MEAKIRCNLATGTASHRWKLAVNETDSPESLQGHADQSTPSFQNSGLQNLS